MKIQTSVRVENTLCDKARTVFSKFGLSFGVAVNIFLGKVVIVKALPFEPSIPSEELKKRIKNVETDKKHTSL